MGFKFYVFAPAIRDERGTIIGREFDGGRYMTHLAAEQARDVLAKRVPSRNFQITTT